MITGNVVLQNCWVVYESIDPEAKEAETMLEEWDSHQATRRYPALRLAA